MYTCRNYKTKKELREAFMAGKVIECYQLGGRFPGTRTGYTTIEGPHGYHKWYARARLEDYILVELDGKRAPANQDAIHARD